MNRDQARLTLFALDSILQKLHIPYFLLCGTALGAHRDKDFCNGDLDIDLGVKHEDLVPKMAKLLEELRALPNMTIRKIETKPYDYDRALHLTHCGVRVDIVDYAMSKPDNKRFCASGKKDYCIVHDAELFENMEQVDFHGRKFYIPTPADTYLGREYGPEWKVPNPQDTVSRTRVYGYRGNVKK